MRQRLDLALVARGLARTRSQAEDLIKRGFISVDGRAITKASLPVDSAAALKVRKHASFVSRAGEKLYSVIEPLGLSFKDKTVLDVGSSTGGFTDVCLQRGANKVIAVDVGTNQMNPSLRQDSRIELHEKTDIRQFQTSARIDLVVADVSFISLREILPSVASLVDNKTEIVAMVKPQFEVYAEHGRSTSASSLKHKGVIKNDKIRRDILKDFENWAKDFFVIEAKADSEVAGGKGNVERFYKLKKV